MLKTYRVPEGAPEFDSLVMKINGKHVPIHAARVSKHPFNRVWPGKQRPLDQTEICGFVLFETDETVTVQIEAAKEFGEVVIRPLSKHIKPVINGKTVEFTLSENGSFTVEFDGYHECLTVFSNPVKDFGIDKNGKDVIYFGPGVHEAGEIEVKSGQTVYLDPEAVVYGAITGYSVHNVQILGYGVLDGSHIKRHDETYYPVLENGVFKDGINCIKSWIENSPGYMPGNIQIWQGEQIKIEGPVLRDSAIFALRIALVDGILIDNIKTIGMWRYNSDGIDFFNSKNAVVQNCFLRNFDDCIVIKGIVGYHNRNNENMIIRGCTVWCDWGGALEIGAETNAPQYRNITFEDCDLIRGTFDYMRIHHNNNADIHNIVYRNIRCEYSKYYETPVLQENDAQEYACNEKKYPCVIRLLIVASGLYGEKGNYKNGNIHDIKFEDIKIFADDEAVVPLPAFTGLDSEHKISNVLIDGLYLNGKRITDKKRITCNEFASGVEIR